jgi:HAMP domain-containing protein
MDVMNDVVSSQSTRDLITNELEGRLDEENEHALHLKQMIEGKEDVMERMRKEFDDLRVQMEKETDTKRNEISDLNGEVVEQSSRVSSRDREFLQLKANMDDMKLQHEAEVALLKREIDEFDANEYEVQRVHHRNISLEDEVSTLRNKLGRMQMNERENSTTLLSPQSSTRVLRTRNDGLKDEVEKLQRKLRRMKRKASRVEI